MKTNKLKGLSVSQSVSQSVNLSFTEYKPFLFNFSLKGYKATMDSRVAIWTLNWRWIANWKPRRASEWNFILWPILIWILIKKSRVDSKWTLWRRDLDHRLIDIDDRNDILGLDIGHEMGLWLVCSYGLIIYRPIDICLILN